MDRGQAAQLLTQGAILIHDYFTSEENIRMSLKSGIIYTEDGYDFTDQFWKLDIFEKGWSVVN